MLCEVTISDGPLGQAAPLRAYGAGASICFEGVVRGIEGGRLIEALVYETYDPMSLRELQRLARDIACKHGLLGIKIEHSRGPVPVGQVSFRLRVASGHRAEGIAAADEFINRLKQEVPLWKVPLWSGVEVST